MRGDNIELTRRRILGGIVTIGAGSAAVGAGTFAFFSDTEESTGNEVTAGTLDLESVSNGAIDVSGVAPDESIPESGTTTISTTYDGTIGSVEVDFDTSIDEPGDEGTEPGEFGGDQSASAFAGQLNVDTANLTKDGSTHADLTSTQGVSTAADLAGLSVDDAFGSVSSGTSVGLELAFTLDSGTGNDFQADGVSIKATFTANQPNAN